MRWAAGIAVVCLVLLAGCAKEPVTVTVNPPESTATEVQTSAPTETPAPTPEPAAPVPEPTATPDPWAADDVEAIARTLSGECYDDKLEDKRLVAEVILNRVSDGRWGDTVIEVVTAKNQFHGYWNPSRDVSDTDREIATQTLRDWYANDCAALSEYLFFEAGPNRENVFRKTF